MFFRRKDLADVEALLRDQGVSVDRTFIRAKLIELVGHARVDRARCGCTELTGDQPS
jgi:hypothetical protein